MKNGVAASAALARIPPFTWRRVIIVHPAAYHYVFEIEERTVGVVHLKKAGSDDSDAMASKSAA
jgi:hypothetical protein